MINKDVEKLLALQDLDLKIRGMKTRSETIPIQINNIQNQIEADKKTFAQEKENLLSEELEIKKIEAKIKEKDEQIKKLQSQSSMVRKNDEYRALMCEINNVKNTISELETQQLILMDKIAENKSKVKDLEERLKSKEKQAQEEIAELNELDAKIKNEIEKTKEERTKLTNGINPQILSTYERILSKGTGIPVAKLVNSICSNCHIKVTPFTENQARKGIFTNCNNCSHIIYIPDEPSHK